MKIKNKERKSDSKQDMKHSRLLPSQYKALSKCREYLQKSLKPEIFKFLQSKDRNFSLSLGKNLSLSQTASPALNSACSSSLDIQQQTFNKQDNRGERISLFLDQLENSDERTFVNFMEVLKEHNKNVFKILDKTVKLFEPEDFNDDDDDYGDDFREFEKSSYLPGYAVLEILKQHKYRNSLQSVEEDELLQNINESNFHLLNEIFDEKDYHAKCFVVTHKAEHRSKPWIKHDSGRKKCSSAKEFSNKTYMAVTTKDIVFKAIHPSSLPQTVTNLPENVEKLFVVDEQSVYSPLPIASEKVDNSSKKPVPKEKYCAKKIYNRGKINSINSDPPPLPPKPDSLTPTPIVKIRDKPRCDLLNSNKNNRSNLINKPSINSGANFCRSYTSDYAPPIPSRQKIDHFSKPPRAIPIPSSTKNSYQSSGSVRSCSNGSHSQFRITNVNYNTDEGDDDNDDDDDGDDDNDDDDDDNLSLNYIIEPEDTDEMEEPYEPITPMEVGKNPANDNANCPTNDSGDFKKETSANVGNIGNMVYSNNPNHNKTDFRFADEIKSCEENERLPKVTTDTKEHLQETENFETDGGNFNSKENKLSGLTLPNEQLVHETENPINKDKIVDSNSNVLKTETTSTAIAITATENDKTNGTTNEKTEDATETLNTTIVSVSRSSSGVSATISDHMTRDSGVDSTVSHSLHDSPYCVSDLMEDLDAVIPNSTASNCHEKQNTSSKHNDSSYYEDIDSMNPCASAYMSHYLDPQSEDTSNIVENNVKYSYDQRVLPTGTLLLCDCTKIFSADLERKTESGEMVNSTNTKEQIWKNLENTILGFDSEGFVYIVPIDCVKKYGDPTNEPWFYPRPLSPKEANIFLHQERQKGCFVVYSPHYTTDECSYYLSVCENNDGDVYHYPIRENVRGDISIEGGDRSFLNLCELVQFYRKNQDNLVARLRRPLKESKLPILPGYHYPEHFEISKKSIRLFGEIIFKDKFGITCKGNYGHQVVLVKSLQQHLVLENEDDFLEEALILMKLNHENIIKLLGVCFRNRPYYIVTENQSGGTLKESLITGVVQSSRPDIQIDICLQIVSAMIYLENLHFVLHRNLKSSNVLINPDSSVKLFNFDRAKIVDDDCYKADISEDVPVRWSAPEIFIHSSYSTKSDVWSLGVVMWEIFSQGQDPYNSLSEQEVIVYVSEKGKLKKSPDCDASMFSIMNQCWKYKPEMRPTFQMLENKLKGQSSIYYETHPYLKSTISNQTSSKLEPYWSNNNNNTGNSSLVLPMKANKRHSHSGPTTPVVLTPSLTSKNSTTHYDDSDSKIDDIMRSMNSNNKHGSGSSSSKHTYSLATKFNANLETSSASLPYTHVIDEECRDNRIRKSLRNFLKRGNLSINKNSE